MAAQAPRPMTMSRLRGRSWNAIPNESRLGCVAEISLSSRVLSGNTGTGLFVILSLCWMGRREGVDDLVQETWLRVCDRRWANLKDRSQSSNLCRLNARRHPVEIVCGALPFPFIIQRADFSIIRKEFNHRIECCQIANSLIERVRALNETPAKLVLRA